MKRPAASDGPQQRKRSKLSPEKDIPFEDPAHLQNAASLLETGAVDPNGYISGRIFMRWNIANRKKRIIIETTSDDATTPASRFEIIFTGTCADFDRELNFTANDFVLLSLKGVRIEKLNRPSGACTLPVKLYYEEGVIVKFIRRVHGVQGEGAVVDTWQCEFLHLSHPFARS